jgi:hypothetical protein
MKRIMAQINIKKAISGIEDGFGLKLNVCAYIPAILASG